MLGQRLSGREGTRTSARGGVGAAHDVLQLIRYAPASAERIGRRPGAARRGLV